MDVRILANIAEKVLWARTVMGMTQRAFANQVGVQPCVIAHLETGGLNPFPENRLKIQDYLDNLNLTRFEKELTSASIFRQLVVAKARLSLSWEGLAGAMGYAKDGEAKRMVRWLSTGKWPLDEQHGIAERADGLEAAHFAPSQPELSLEPQAEPALVEQLAVLRAEVNEARTELKTMRHHLHGLLLALGCKPGSNETVLPWVEFLLAAREKQQVSHLKPVPNPPRREGGVNPL